MNPLVVKAADLAWHQVRRAIGVMCVLATVGFIGFSVWRVFNPKAKFTTENKNVIRQVERVQIDQRQIFPEKKDAFFFGIKLWDVKFGVSVGEKEKIETEVNEVDQNVNDLKETQ